MAGVHPDRVFIPVGVLALWTLLVALLVGVRRVRASSAGRVPRGAFKLGEVPGLPADVSLPNRNLMNLLELPVLFYVAVLGLHVTHHVTPGVLALAWVYVGFRLLHSAVHLTTNYIPYRLGSFAASNVVLTTLWGVFLKTLF